MQISPSADIPQHVWKNLMNEDGDVQPVYFEEFMFWFQSREFLEDQVVPCPQKRLPEVLSKKDSPVEDFCLIRILVPVDFRFSSRGFSGDGGPLESHLWGSWNIGVEGSGWKQKEVFKFTPEPGV